MLIKLRVKTFLFSCWFSHQALHRPPPAPVKEHRVSPIQEDSLSGHVNEDPLQNVGAGAEGVPHGTVGSVASNKKPRSRTKVRRFFFVSVRKCNVMK